MDQTNRLFRKATFGGFNKEDVMQYIETMKTEFFDYKAQVEETIRELNEKLESLEQSDSSAPIDAAPAAQSDDPAVSIHEATDHLKQVADELCDKMSRLLGRLQPEDPETAPEPEPDQVQQLLDKLFEQPQQSPAAVSKAERTFDLNDVLPAYLK